MSLSITQELWARYLHNIHVHKHLHTVPYTFTEIGKLHIIRWSRLQNQYTVDNRYLISLHSFRTYFSVLSQSRSHSNELSSRLHLRFEYEWELWRVGTLFVCLLIEHFPLGWITHSMMTRCSRAKNDAPQTPAYSDSFKWIPQAPLMLQTKAAAGI